MTSIISKDILFAKNELLLITAPTCITGTTQSGKSIFALNQMLNIDNKHIAIYIDFKKDKNIKVHLMNEKVNIVIEGLDQFRELKNIPNKLIFRSKDAESISILVEYLHELWANNDFNQTLYLFFDEIQNYQFDEVIRVFTQGFGNDVIGVAISQRPQLVSQTIIDNCDNIIIFRSTGNAILKMKKNNDIELPEDIQNYINNKSEFNKVLFDQKDFRKL